MEISFLFGALLAVSIMLFLMLLGIPIPYSLGAAAIPVAYFVYGPSSLETLGWMTFKTLYNINWTPLPLFVLMACILAETKIGEDIYIAARLWLSRLPGGLIVASIFGQAAISAAVGSSAAAILAVGKVAEPEFKRYGYNKPFAMAGLTCGGVLGPLIPPSIGFITYGVLSETSIGRLFMAGILPGIILVIILAGVTMLICFKNPHFGPPVTERITWRQRISSLRRVWSVGLIFAFILGCIYFGIATPTEVAGLGALAVFVIASSVYGMKFSGFLRALRETALINGMILFMMVSAFFFSYVIGTSGASKKLVTYVTSLEVSPWVIVIIINMILIILGCFIDGLTIMLLTVPLFVPLITSFGFDPIWFGVVFVVNMEIGFLTPPMGLQLFLVRTAFDIPVADLIRYMWPYFLALFGFLALVIAFPEMSLWIPNRMVAK